MSATAPVRAWPARLPRPRIDAADHAPAATSRPATARTGATAPARAAAPARPRLAVVAKPATAGRAPFVLALGLVLAGGLVALLLLHTLAAQDAFTLHGLQRTSAGLADDEQQLQLANQQAQAPSALAARAAALGMVPATTVSVGRMHGRPIAVLSAPPRPRPAPTTAATPAATATASPGATTRSPATKPTASKPTATKPSPGPTTAARPSPGPTAPH